MREMLLFCRALEGNHRFNTVNEVLCASFCLLMLCSVWARSFQSPVNGKLNIDLFFLFKKHKLHFKKINLPNSNYKAHILGACIIQSISVRSEHCTCGRMLQKKMLHNDQWDRMLDSALLGLTVSTHKEVLAGYLREAIDVKMQRGAA